MNRRYFNKLAAAAFGGIVTGTLVGCGAKGDKKAEGEKAGTTKTGDAHACAGLNGCKGEGADKKNACAGQGGCATASMAHECKGHNACKGQGGCGEAPTENACKGQGGCAVPIKDQASWDKARAKFEDKMKAAGKTVGAAPAKS